MNVHQEKEKWCERDEKLNLKKAKPPHQDQEVKNHEELGWSQKNSLKDRESFCFHRLLEANTRRRDVRGIKPRVVVFRSFPFVSVTGLNLSDIKS